MVIIEVINCGVVCCSDMDASSPVHTRRRSAILFVCIRTVLIVISSCLQVSFSTSQYSSSCDSNKPNYYRVFPRFTYCSLHINVKTL